MTTAHGGGKVLFNTEHTSKWSDTRTQVTVPGFVKLLNNSVTINSNM